MEPDLRGTIATFGKGPVRIMLTKADFLRMQLEQFPPRGSSWIVWALFVVAVGLHALRSSVASGQMDFAAIIASALLGGTVGYVVVTSGFLLLIISMSRPGEGWLRERMYTFGEDGVHEESSGESSFFRWSAVRTARRTKNFVLVTASTRALHLFPKRCFAPQAFDDLWTLIQVRSDKVRRH